MVRFMTAVLIAAGVALSLTLASSIDLKYDHGLPAAVEVATDVPPAAVKPVAKRSFADPRAEIAETSHDFGVVEPLRSQSYAFEIRNTGTAPLTLTKHDTGCKCLELVVADATIPPGSSGRVVALWQPQPSHDIFRKTARLTTNDPTNPTIDLTLRGKARVLLAADPPELVATRIRPNQSATIRTHIVSETWEAFEIDGIESSLAGADWQLTPADSGVLKQLNVKSGWQLAVTLPSDLDEGEFRETLHFTAKPLGDMPEELSQPLEREIPLTGNVLRRLAVYGKEINIWGTIEIGQIDPLVGYEASFVLKAYDDDPELRVTEIRAQPDFIEARIEPFDDGKTPGTYRMTVRIPPVPQSTPGVYQVENQGKLTIAFDHPRIEPLELGIDFYLTKLPGWKPGGSQVAMVRE
jgi:hypothetical protein